MNCHKSGSSHWTTNHKAHTFWCLKATWLVTTATLSPITLWILWWFHLSVCHCNLHVSCSGVWRKNSGQFYDIQDPRAPVQFQTTPRLELLFALLLSQLIDAVLKGLQSMYMYPRLQLKCYTDSQVALYWIQGVEREWKPFVQNRMTEIRQLTAPTCWAHLPGASNPAYLPSRAGPYAAPRLGGFFCLRSGTFICILN